ncbi:MAG: thioredoxin family protein [Planctomycetes bacterium]|nr:thioredoxin family protein [Planctomycetota bacterium]
MADLIRELTDDDFAAGIATGVVLVDFYGTYCPPCKLLEPVLEQLATRYAGRAVVARINIDEYSEAAVDNTVEDIPTIILFQDGKERGRLFGSQNLETLSGEVDRLLS